MDEADARATVRAHVDSDDFELEEFPEGWLVVRRFSEPMMGAATFAVERATDALLRFPSSVPPEDVMLSFEEVKARWRQVDESSR